VNITQEWALYLLLHITQFLGSHSLIDAAESLAFIRMGFPAKGSWLFRDFRHIQLHGEGQVLWVEDIDLSALSSSMVSDMDSTSSEGLMEEVSSLAPPRRRGRPCKADTPLVIDQVKRCTSNNNKGTDRCHCLMGQ
jgi:hypothetical protein